MKHSVAFLLLSCFLLLVVGKGRETKPLMTGDEIINKHLEAIGGKGTISKIQSRIAIGTVKKENEPEAQMAIVSESPNRVSAVFVFTKYDWQLTYDGTKSFVRPMLPRDLSAIQDKYDELLASGLMFNNISLYNALIYQEASGAKFEAKGMKKIRGNQTYVVEMKRPKVPSTKLFFDANTFMWVRTEYGKVYISKPMGAFTNENIPRAEDDLNIDFFFETSDFREVNGIKLPFKFEQVVTYPIIQQKKVGILAGTIKEYRHNEKIDAKMFK